MNERQFRTAVIAVAAVILGVRILIALALAHWAGEALDNRQWGWAAFDLIMALLYLRDVVKMTQEINEHGVMGRSPWWRDRDE